MSWTTVDHTENLTIFNIQILLEAESTVESQGHKGCAERNAQCLGDNFDCVVYIMRVFNGHGEPFTRGCIDPGRHKDIDGIGVWASWRFQKAEFQSRAGNYD